MLECGRKKNNRNFFSVWARRNKRKLRVCTRWKTTLTVFGVWSLLFFFFLFSYISNEKEKPKHEQILMSHQRTIRYIDIRFGRTVLTTCSRFLVKWQFASSVRICNSTLNSHWHPDSHANEFVNETIFLFTEAPQQSRSYKSYHEFLLC